MNPVLQGVRKQGVIPQNFVNKPVLTGTDGPNAPQWEPNASPFFAIQVDATDDALAAGAHEVILFDTNRQYQNRTGNLMPLELVITAPTEPGANGYQALVDDINEVGSYVDVIQMQICNGDGSACNFNLFPSLDLMYSQRGQRPTVIKTLHPQMGTSENQYHLDRATFQADMRITQRHALIFNIQKGTKVLLSFYQALELGRK